MIGTKINNKYWDRLPETDEEASEWLDNLYSADIAITLKSIYRINRKKGASVLGAWGETIKSHLVACGYEA